MKIKTAIVILPHEWILYRFSVTLTAAATEEKLNSDFVSISTWACTLTS